MAAPKSPTKLTQTLFFGAFTLLLLAPLIYTAYLACVLLICFITLPFLSGYTLVLTIIFSALYYWLWKRTLPKKLFLLTIISPILAVILTPNIGMIVYNYNQTKQENLDKKMLNIQKVQTTNENIIYTGKEFGIEFSTPKEGHQVKEEYKISEHLNSDIPDGVTADITIQFPNDLNAEILSTKKITDEPSEYRDSEASVKKYTQLIDGRTANATQAISNNGLPGTNDPKFDVAILNYALVTKKRDIKINIRYRPSQQEIVQKEIDAFLQTIKISE